jgi:XisI protein
MDRIDTYRQIVCQFLEEFATDDPEAYLVFDRQSDRYLVIHNGWRGESRIYDTHRYFLHSSKTYPQRRSGTTSGFRNTNCLG